MRNFFAKRGLDAFEARYEFDVSYMRHMLQYSPAAFFKFAKATETATHREIVPAEALYAAKIVGAVAEDCGPCAQLDVDMALEAGVAPDQVEAVLKRDRAAMNEDTAVGFQFADAFVRRSPDEDEARDWVRHRWGEAGVIELTLGLQFARIFPMVKAGLGYSKSCRRVAIDAGSIDVVKEAA